jgi:hypothetical protein
MRLLSSGLDLDTNGGDPTRAWPAPTRLDHGPDCFRIVLEARWHHAVRSLRPNPVIPTPACRRHGLSERVDV